MATTISNLTNSTNLDGLLKKVYLPTMQHTAYDDDRFSSMIQARTNTTLGGGNHIVHFASTQRAEGVGAFAEGGNWVSNVPIKGKQLTENVVYLNAYVALTGPVIKAANSGQKSAVNVVTETFRTNIRSFKNYFDMMLMGDSSGRLARVSSISGAAITLTNTSFPTAPYMADMFVPVGARVNCATFDSTGIVSTGFCNANSDDDYGFIIGSHTSRDLDNGTAVIHLDDEDGTDYAAGGTTNIAANDYFVREGSYGTPSTSAVTFANYLGMNGISGLVSDGSNNSETSTNFTSIWGVTRTDAGYGYLISYTKDFSSARLDEENATAMMLDLQFSRQAQPNLLLTSPKIENMYFLEKKDDRRFNNVGPMNFVGGYERMGVQLGEWQLILTSLGACPQSTLFVINTNDFAFCQNSPLTWVLGDGGNILVQSHTGDNKFASAVQYVNFVCFDPYRQAKGYSVAQT
jgi:hypothetical protein